LLKNDITLILQYSDPFESKGYASLQIERNFSLLGKLVGRYENVDSGNIVNGTHYLEMNCLV
jgi:hypothetical protein